MVMLRDAERLNAQSGGSGSYSASTPPTMEVQAPSGQRPPVAQVPPTGPDTQVGVADLNNPTLGNNPFTTNTEAASGPSLDELYPTAAGAEAPSTPTVATPDSADVTNADLSVANVATPGQAQANTGLLSQAEGVTAEQTAESPGQQVDAELARILGKDSPLLSRARAEAARAANARGLQNSSIAVGAAEGAMVDRALPMAQQNAAQNFQRASDNTALRQNASMFTADQQNRLRALEAELGTQVSVFNAEQLNRAEQLTAQMRTALEQGNQQAANQAAMQFAELQRSAQQQQADIDFTAEQQRADAVNQNNRQIIDSVTALNEQYLRGSQAIDLATIQGQYQQLIQVNETAGSLNQQFMDSIGSIMSNQDMTPAQIASAVQNLQRGLEASLRLIAEMNDMDLGDLNITYPGTGGGGGNSGGGGRRPGDYR